MKKRVLITGASGFLGRSLFEYLKGKKTSCQVFGLDVKRTVSQEIFFCDLAQKKKLKNILKKIKPHYIFHFAGGQASDQEKLFEINVGATETLFESVKETKNLQVRIIIPGSAAEYGAASQGKKPLKESDPPRPISWYGFVKFMQTSLSLMYFHKGIDVVIARIFNVIGCGTPVSLSVGRFAHEIALVEKKKNKKIISTRDLNGKRDVLDIDDVCSALWKIAANGKSGETYNVCSGKSYTMRSLLKSLLTLSGQNGFVIKEKKADGRGILISRGSNAKIKRVTGWMPKVSVEKSLKRTLECCRRDLHK